METFLSELILSIAIRLASVCNKLAVTRSCNSEQVRCETIQRRASERKPELLACLSSVHRAGDSQVEDCPG
jgi:hypothetical protein